MSSQVRLQDPLALSRVVLSRQILQAYHALVMQKVDKEFQDVEDTNTSNSDQRLAY